MKILLTGATGFIGSHIFDLLEMEESYIRVISRPESAKNLKQNFPSEQIIITDNLFTENHSFLCELLEDIDIIIHTAWYAEPGKYLQSHKNLECLLGTISLAEAANDAKRATRNYAKRQTTWFRNQFGKSERIFAQYSESLLEEIFSKIRF